MYKCEIYLLEQVLPLLAWFLYFQFYLFTEIENCSNKSYKTLMFLKNKKKVVDQLQTYWNENLKLIGYTQKPVIFIKSRALVCLSGFEPETYSVGGCYSIQLRYKHILFWFCCSYKLFNKVVFFNNFIRYDINSKILNLYHTF